MHQLTILTMALALAMGTAATAHAQLMEGPTPADAGLVAPPPAPTPTPAEAAEADPVGAIGGLVQDIRAGNWRLAAAAALALLMLLLAKVRNLVPWFKGDRGGAILVGILGLSGALSAALVTSEPLGLDLFAGALATTWTAVGGYTWIKRLWRPSDQAEGKLPLPAPE